MYHIIYLTTNLVNSKIYVGVHSTYNLDDGYLGSGKHLLRSIKKYGKHNFKRQILHYCLDDTHAYELERLIVDSEFIKHSNTYNIVLGGIGGDISQRKGKTYVELYGENKAKILSEMTSKRCKNMKVSDETKHKQSLIKIGHKQSNETIQKRMVNMQRDKHHQAKTFEFISPSGIHYIVNGGFSHFCKEHNISRTILIKMRNIKIIESMLRNIHTQTVINTIGWCCKEIY